MSKNNNIKIITFANIQIDLYLILNQNDLRFLNLTPNFLNEINNLYDLENWFNQFQLNNENNTDVNFISNLFKIETNNFIINTCLYINRINKDKVDFEILSNMIFYEEDFFLEKLLKIACEKNNIFLKKLNINLECPELNFIIKIISNEGKDCNLRSFSNKKFLTEKENDEINIYKNPENLINFFNFRNKDYFLFDLNSYIINSITYIKNNNVNLNSIIQNIHNFLISLLKLDQKLKLIIIFPKLNIECLNSFNSITINYLKDIIKISNIYYIEKRISNLIYEIFSNNKTEKNEPISLIKLLSKENNNLNPKKYNSQIGIFFDNFIEISFFEQEISSSLILSYGKYKFDIFDNNERLEENELVLKESFLFFESLNLSGILSRLIKKRKFITCHLAGNLLVKRFLELKKQKLELCIDEKFCLIKIKRKKDLGNKINESTKKEGDFLLDCINKKSSSLKIYNPLFDKNLFQFFHLKSVKNHLSKLGFINKKGEILDSDKIENSKYKKNKLELYNNEKRKFLYFKEKKENITEKINLLKSINESKNRIKIQKKLPSIVSFSKDISDLYSLHGGKMNKKSK